MMMKYRRWEDLDHKGTVEQRAEIDSAARAELDRIGFGALRRAREQTQVELAGTLGLPQSSISDIENRGDLLLSTLAKYIRALGGELQMLAVFPEATFNLMPPDDALAKAAKRHAARRPKTERKAETKPRRALAKAA